LRSALPVEAKMLGCCDFGAGFFYSLGTGFFYSLGAGGFYSLEAGGFGCSGFAGA